MKPTQIIITVLFLFINRSAFSQDHSPRHIKIEYIGEISKPYYTIILQSEGKRIDSADMFTFWTNVSDSLFLSLKKAILNDTINSKQTLLKYAFVTNIFDGNEFITVQSYYYSRIQKIYSNIAEGLKPDLRKYTLFNDLVKENLRRLTSEKILYTQ